MWSPSPWCWWARRGRARRRGEHGLRRRRVDRPGVVLPGGARGGSVHGPAPRDLLRREQQGCPGRRPPRVSDQPADASDQRGADGRGPVCPDQPRPASDLRAVDLRRRAHGRLQGPVHAHRGDGAVPGDHRRRGVHHPGRRSRADRPAGPGGRPRGGSRDRGVAGPALPHPLRSLRVGAGVVGSGAAGGEAPGVEEREVHRRRAVEKPLRDQAAGGRRVLEAVAAEAHGQEEALDAGRRADDRVVVGGQRPEPGPAARDARALQDRQPVDGLRTTSSTIEVHRRRQVVAHVCTSPGLSSSASSSLRK